MLASLISDQQLAMLASLYKLFNIVLKTMSHDDDDDNNIAESVLPLSKGSFCSSLFLLGADRDVDIRGSLRASGTDAIGWILAETTRLPDCEEEMPSPASPADPAFRF